MSRTVTVNEQLAVLPLASVTTNVFVVVPIGKMEAEGNPAVCAVVEPAQPHAIAVAAGGGGAVGGGDQLLPGGSGEIHGRFAA